VIIVAYNYGFGTLHDCDWIKLEFYSVHDHDWIKFQMLTLRINDFWSLSAKYYLH